jgi:predicted CXXCH cytochrome family protein
MTARPRHSTSSLARAAAPVALAMAAIVAPAAGRAAVVSARAAAAAGRCGTCHPTERVAFEQSVHAREDVRCVSCHGGDDTNLEKSVAHGRGFRGRPARAAVPALCASCHADEQRMRAYDLPVDQYALYQTSAHGLRLKAGDTRVAVCSDCHGAHDILPPTDPASRVYVTNIPRTCGGCHADSTRVGKANAVYNAYLTSVHARELLDKGNLRAPTCVSCHGVHGAAPPAVGDVNKVCGRCHTAEQRYFLAGPHPAGMAENKLPQCSSCHGDHAIAPASPDRLGKLCGDCHAEGGKEVALGGRMLEDYRGAADEIRGAEAVIARAEAVPIQTDDYHARLEEARTLLREALTSAHSVNPEVISGFTLRARSLGREIRNELQSKLGQIRTNKLLLILFWFYVLVTVGILRRLRDRQPRVR